MKFAASITALSYLSLGALGLVAPVNPLESRTISEASWGFQVTPGGPTVVLNGTIEEVHAQLLKLNPDWDAQFPHGVSREEKRGYHVISTGTSIHVDFTGAKVHCGSPWKDCSTDKIKDGANYLRGVGGLPSLAGGPGECTRVSCSYGAAIWWCNDNPTPKTLWDFPSIANGVDHIVQECAKNSASSVSGQIFHPENWNVVVTKGSC